MNQTNVERLFHEALALTSLQERAELLDRACGGDLALRAKVEGLLDAHERTVAFLPTEPGDRAKVEPPSEGPGTVIGRYKLLQQIGEGGMGVVYMAEQTEPVVRKVALKIIKLGMDTRQVVARFEAERQALALMDHPHIAKVLDAGATDTGRPYFVMELVRGIPITEYCDKNHLSARQRLELLIPVCQAIQHAHQKGVIHRDIKPSNVLVTLNDGRPLPMVIDFGIAKATNQRLTEKTLFTNFSQMIGTPAYMSPEQAEMSKLDVDTRTDVYSLGVLLYELLTGTTPFTSKELMEAGYGGMQKIIAEKEPPRPSTRLGTMQQEQRTSVTENRRMEYSALTRLFQGDLDWIVMKCLEKERGRRYETASGLAADLQRHLQSEPVVARPPTAAYRFQKAIRRNRFAFAAGGAVVAALVLGLGAATWQAFRATNAERVQATLREAAEKATALEVTARQAAVTAQARTAASEQNAQQLLYAANMNLVQAAWEQNNIVRVRQLLADTAAAPYRGFEWYYWQRETHREILSLRGHQGAIRAVAYSPDAQRILTGSDDSTARIWDAVSGRELMVLRIPSNCITSVAFSPDGRRAVTGEEPLWNPPLRVPKGSSAPSPARVWDTATGRELLTLEGHVAGISSVAFSQDGKRILTSAMSTTLYGPSPDNTAKIWDAETGRALLTLQGHTRGIASAAFSPDGRHAATVSVDGTARIWDLTTGSEILSHTTHDPQMSSVHFSPDGLRLLIACEKSARVLNVATGVEQFALRDHTRGVIVAKFSPDGRRIVTGGGDASVKLWDATDGKHLGTLKGHASVICCVDFSPDAKRLVTGSGYDLMPDNVARVWDLSGEDERIHLQGESNRFTQISYSPGGERVLAAGTNRTIRVWDSASGREQFSVRCNDRREPILGVSSDGQWAMSDDPNGNALIWELATGRELFRSSGQGSNAIFGVFSPTGKYVATSGWGDAFSRICETATGKHLFTFQRSHHPGRVLALSPDGRKMLGAGLQHTVKLWDVENSKEIFNLDGHSSMISAGAFSRDGRKAVTVSYDRTGKVWDLISRRELFALRGHAEYIMCVDFSPDGERIVTGSADSTVRVWDGNSGQELLVLRGSHDDIWSVHFSPDGRRILVGTIDSVSDDLTTPGPIWDAATSEQVARWQQEEREDAARLAALRNKTPATAEPAPAAKP